jgi:hypothetical protein
MRVSVLFRIKSSLAILMIMAFSSLSLAEADTANPPVITGVTIDTTKTYKPGDEYVIEVKYTGGLPSLRQANLLLYTKYQPNNAAYTCLGGAPTISSFSYNFPFTPKYTLSDPGVVKFYGQILSSCVEGANYFFGLAKLEDSTLLLAPSFSVEFTLRVSGGLRIPPGTIRPTRRDPSPPLLSFDSPVYVSTQSTYELPAKNLEGITLNWFVDTPLICDLEREYPFQLGGKLKFLTEGQCILNGQANVDPNGRDAGGENSSFNELRFIKKFQVYRDKAAADAKAIADKAVADAKAIADMAAADANRKAAADANRKEQTISVSPLRTGSVLISSSGLPIQVKSTSNLSVFAYNSTDNVCVFENGIIRTKISGRCVIGFSQEGNSEFKPASNLILDFIITSANTKTTTITCVKGKLTKKVSAVKPKCPAEYKVKK